jgi:hypothetical protein
MRVEAIVACIMTVLVAALYQSYPFECDEAAASLGRAILRLVGPPDPPSRGVGETALMRSSATGNLAMVGFLLDQGGDPNRQDQVRPRSLLPAGRRLEAGVLACSSDTPRVTRRCARTETLRSCEQQWAGT